MKNRVRALVLCALIGITSVYSVFADSMEPIVSATVAGSGGENGEVSAELKETDLRFVEEVLQAIQDEDKENKSRLSRSLTDKDFSLKGITVGAKAPLAAETMQKNVRQGMFMVYGDIDFSYRFYDGADAQKDDSLRTQGLTYEYEPGEIVSLNLTKGDAKTAKEVGIGSYRGEVLFSYGAPQAILRLPEKNKTVFVYAYHKDKLQQPAIYANKKENRYLFFTIANSKVEKITIIDGGILSEINIPKMNLLEFKPNQLRDEDFVLCGKRLGEFYEEPAHEHWRYKGSLDGDNFVSYSTYLVGYDKKHKISNLSLLAYAVTTPRGIGVGDTAFVLQEVYGKPTYIKEYPLNEEGKKAGDIAEGDLPEKGEVVLAYKHPEKEDEYLVFTVDLNDGYISGVELARQYERKPK